MSRSSSPSTPSNPGDSDSESSSSSSSASGGSNTRLQDGGASASRAFQPPPGSVPFEHGQADSAEFDWDAIEENDDIELVLIRAPHSIKPKHLEGLELNVGRGPVGSLQRKHQSYNVHRVSHNLDEGVRAEELSGLKFLLPRRSEGNKLFISGKPIYEKLVICGDEEGLAPDSEPVNIPPAKRFKYPAEMLSHAYIPFGADRRDLEITSITGTHAMDVDQEKAPEADPIGKENASQSAAKPHKKRKGGDKSDGKKSKRSKTAT